MDSVLLAVLSSLAVLPCLFCKLPQIGHVLTSKAVR
jgi:hypothetical protein